MLSRPELFAQIQDFLARFAYLGLYEWHLRLVQTAAGTIGVDTDWSVIGTDECDWYGYAKMPIDATYFLPAANDGDTVYVESTTFLFMFNLLGPGIGVHNYATYLVLTRTLISSGAVEFMDALEISPAIAFLTPGTHFETRYRRVALNCAE